MKYFNNCKTIEELKKAYKRLAFQHHPDRGGDMEIMKAINNEYEKTIEILKAQSTNKQDKSSTEQAKDFINIINNIISLDGLIIEIVGNWVWVTGNTKEHKEILKANGFYYASKKKAWYFKPSDYTGRSRKNYTLEEIKGKYGSIRVEGTGTKKGTFKPQLT